MAPVAVREHPGQTVRVCTDDGSLRRARARILYVSAVACLVACQGRSEAGVGSLAFEDVTRQAGIDASYDFDDEVAEAFFDRAVWPKDEYIKMFGGVAAGDPDGDGWMDLFVLRGQREPALYINRGDGTFAQAPPSQTPHTDTFASGPLFADLDADGDHDLVVGGYGEVRVALFRNEAGAGFTEISADQGLVASLETVGPGLGDFDGDGDLDVLMARWGHFFDEDDERRELAWRNDLEDGFVDVSDKLRYHAQWIEGSGYNETAFTPNFADIDGDGDADLLLASDFDSSDVMRNESSGGSVAFRSIVDRDVITEDDAMGAAVGDYDNDGDLDWFVSSISAKNAFGYGEHTGNRLYENQGDGTFFDVTERAGVRDGSWGWGSCFADFDNDGHLDVFHVNGWGYRDTEVRRSASEFLDDAARLFLSRGDGTFLDVAVQVGAADTGQGRGVVCFDYDRDGDVDVFLTNTGGPARLLANQVDPGGDVGDGAAYLTIRLVGQAPNYDAIGARVTVESSDSVQLREVRVTNNYVSQDPFEVHFGVGFADSVDVVIRWPGGAVQTLPDVGTRQYLVVSRE